jgi:hypothetical protein
LSQNRQAVLRKDHKALSYLEDLAKLKNQPSIDLPKFHLGDLTVSDQTSLGAMKSRIGVMASHMFKQLQEHNEAIANTNRIFDQLLDDIENICRCFKESMTQRDVPDNRIYSQVDADRSVGILNILWHSVSFTARGNTKPLALYRSGREPIFTGRILALHGDFHEIATEFQEEDYPGGLIHYEVASLYVPADTTAPAVMKIKHLGEEEHYFHQADAARLFLLKTVEMICGGGFYHEKDI